MSNEKTVGTISASNPGDVKCKPTNETFNVTVTETETSQSQRGGLKLVLTEDILGKKSETDCSSYVKVNEMVCALKSENGYGDTLESFNLDRSSEQDLAAAKITITAPLPQAELPSKEKEPLVITKHPKTDVTNSTGAAIGDELKTQTNCTRSAKSKLNRFQDNVAAKEKEVATVLKLKISASDSDSVFSDDSSRSSNKAKNSNNKEEDSDNYTAISVVKNVSDALQDAPVDTDTIATDQESNTLESHITEVDVVSTESVDEDGHKFVNYREEDFKTDSELEDSGSSKEMGSICMKSKRKKEGQRSPVLRKKQKIREMQSSSSGDDDDRPQCNDRQKPLFSSRQADKEKYEDREGKYPDFLKNLHPRLASFRRQWSDKDTLEYRRGYPGKKDVKNQKENLLFYTGKIPSQPNGAFIDEIHDDWYYDLDRLERHHGYIQWLFPIRESGMNWHAQELQQHETEGIKADKKAMDRFIKSYRMMLHFYGIKLVNIQTGGVQREKNWQARFQHLNYSMHNYLRITRILKCLGEMGLEHYKVPLLKFLLWEAIQTKTLSRTLESCYCYWIGTIKDDCTRADLKEYANQLCWEVETAKNGANGKSNSGGRLEKRSERDSESHKVDQRKEGFESLAVIDTKALGEGMKVAELEKKNANSIGDRKVSSVESKYFCQKETSTTHRVVKDMSCRKNENLDTEEVPEMESEKEEKKECEGKITMDRGKADKNKSKQQGTDSLLSSRKENKNKQKKINDYFH